MNDAARNTLLQAAPPGLASLRELSARLGANPLLTQAANGNTSIKIGSTLWIKGTGKWLTDSLQDEMFVSLNLAAVREAMEAEAELTHAWASASGLRPSVETPLHAVLPHTVVLHVHSINCIAWALRSDAPEQLRNRLHGLRWQWIPYVASGMPLARAVQAKIATGPETDVWVLGNHGLVVCGENCESAEFLLEEVERRLATSPRLVTSFETTLLALSLPTANWRCPDLPVLHTLGTDVESCRMLQGGCLYPAQAIFLGSNIRTLPCYPPLSDLVNYANGQDGAKSFVIVERAGVVLNETVSSAETSALIAFSEVLRRVDASAPLRYLTGAEIAGLTGD